MMRLLLSIILLWGVLPTISADASDLPPIGQRKYVINDQDPSAPVTIENSKTKIKQTYLKDPMNSKPAKIVKSKPSKRRLKAKENIANSKRRVVESRLAFRPLAVNGRKTKPRVSFKRDLIKVNRADEPLDKDFYERVFLPALDANF